MSNEGESEDRLTMIEFAELIQHLSAQEILTIEYRVDTTWKKLFARKNVSTQIFVCNLCCLEASSFKSLLSHVDGRKHKLQMELVLQLYHPDYTYPKTYKKDIVEKPENPPSNCTITSTVLCNNDMETFENGTKNKTDNFKSNTNLLESNNTSEAFTENNNENNASDTIKTQTVTEHATSSKEKTNESEVKNLEAGFQNVDTEKNKSAKSDEKTLNVGSNLKETKKMSSVVAEKRSLSNINFEEKVVGNSKKSKIVVNPAATLSSKASLNMTNKVNDKDIEKPRYQMDKIIIPTVHKNKSHNDDKVSSSTILQKHSNELPKFSEKAFTPKPSDNDIIGILGVEYVIKILKSRSDKSPRYECGLCELVFDGFVMQKHLEGYNHRLKFCEKHFPTAIRHYRQYMQNLPESELCKIMTSVLAKLAVAIEQHHGRNLPYECSERDFNINRHEILARAFSCRHASEQYGPTFTHVVGSKEIDELINNRHTFMPPTSSRTAIFDVKPGSASSKSGNEFNSRDHHRHTGREINNSNAIKPVGNTDKSYMSSGFYEEIYPPPSIYTQPDNRNIVQHVDDETYNLMVDDFLKGTLKGISGGSSSSRLRDRRKRSISPEHNLSSAKRKSLSPLRRDDVWQGYRHMVDQELYNLNERFQQYRKDPETHPSYNEEWQKFWKRRKEELVSAGLDHRKYNYQPEWVRFIKIRIEELYSEDVENLKLKSRERLCLPMTNDNISDVKYHVQAPTINTTTDSITTTSHAHLFSSNDSIPQAVSVLRLMTALEDSLGFLGPKIIDLLSKALQAEKTNPLHVNAIILTDDNCSLIETAKEKFKGLVITGLLDGSKKRVLKQVVNDTEMLLKYASEYRQLLATQRSSIEYLINRPQNNASSFLLDSTLTNASGTVQNQQNYSDTANASSRKSQSSSSITENILTRVSKKELASKLAASLVAQGKTDFDPQQLQQLIAVYKLIEKKKTESAGTGLNNTSCSTLPAASSSLLTKKTLSNTLSDLLKSSKPDDSNNKKSASSAQGLSSDGQQFSLNIDSAGYQQNNISSNTPNQLQNYVSSNSSTSVFQNSNDNYFNNTAQSMNNATYYGNSSGGGGGNLLEQPRNYGYNYGNNLTSHQRNSNTPNLYNNQYQNNNTMMTQNWAWNTNLEMNQNYNMRGSNNYNNYNKKHF